MSAMISELYHLALPLIVKILTAGRFQFHGEDLQDPCLFKDGAALHIWLQISISIAVLYQTRSYK